MPIASGAETDDERRGTTFFIHAATLVHPSDYQRPELAAVVVAVLVQVASHAFAGRLELVARAALAAPDHAREQVCQRGSTSSAKLV
jgi:hypothetical protein